MTWVDGVVLAVLALSAVVAYFRGFVREVLSVAAWIGAAAAAILFRGEVSPLLETSVQPPWVAEALAAAGIFLVVLILLKFLTAAIANRVQDSILGDVDRALGLAFGLARGAFVVILAYILAGMAVPSTEQWPEPVRNARLLPLVVEGAQWLAVRMPEGVQPRIVPSPAAPPPTQDDLMRPRARERT
jgi:membrane protein required for colicin V production